MTLHDRAELNSMSEHLNVRTVPYAVSSILNTFYPPWLSSTSHKISLPILP